MDVADPADLTATTRQSRLGSAARELLALLSEGHARGLAVRTTLRQSRFARVVEELFVLATIAWIILICLRDGLPAGAPHFAGAWFAYTWATAVVDFVFLPLLPVLAVGIPLVWLVSSEPNYWPVYRLASIVAIVWLIGASIGLWRMQ